MDSVQKNKLFSIPTFLAYYIVGFVDGEGSFNLSFRKRDDFLIGWKITPVFNISQKENKILRIIADNLGCGHIRFRKDGLWVYEVESRSDIMDTIIPFLSDKKRDDFDR